MFCSDPYAGIYTCMHTINYLKRSYNLRCVYLFTSIAFLYLDLAHAYHSLLCALPTVPCSPDVSLTCPTDSRCLTHSTTGTSFCLQSCFMQNGGCSEDQTCYSQQTDENCNPLLESCFTSSCSDTTTGIH